MGVDYYFSFGYGFMIPNVKNMEELDSLEELIHSLGDKVRYCQDAYTNEKDIFICIAGFNTSYWDNHSEGDDPCVVFCFSDEDYLALEQVANRYNVSEDKMNWIGFHYHR